MPLWPSPRKTGAAGLCSEEAARSCDAGELPPLGLSGENMHVNTSALESASSVLDIHGAPGAIVEESLS